MWPGSARIAHADLKFTFPAMVFHSEDRSEAAHERRDRTDDMSLYGHTDDYNYVPLVIYLRYTKSIGIDEIADFSGLFGGRSTQQEAHVTR
jgi:hypothetical protein